MNSNEMIQRYLLGVASSEEVQELENRLLHDEQLQDEYLQQVELDTLLRREAQSGVRIDSAQRASHAGERKPGRRYWPGIWKWATGIVTLASTVLLTLLIVSPTMKNTALAYPSLGEVVVKVPWAEQNIWAAAGRGDLLELRRELRKNPAVDARLHNELTPLHVATLYNRVEAVELLLERGADVTITDSRGNTALHVASFWGYEQLVEVLLKAGASPAVRNQLGFTSSDLVAIEWSPGLQKCYRQLKQDLKIPADLAQIEAARPNIRQLLVEVAHNDAGGRPPVSIWQAVVTGNARAVEQHIAAGTDLNKAEDLGGSTPLMLAAIYGHRGIGTRLIAAGADLELQNKPGDTALYQACFFCQPEMVELLLKAGASPDRRNKHGLTPLNAVTLPLDDGLQAVYAHVYNLVGLEFDIEHVRATRPRIAAILNTFRPDR